MLRFLLVDDHPLVRQELRDAVRHHFPDIEVGEAATADLAGTLHKTPWDLIIMDTTMFGKSGPQTLQELKHACPAVPVLVLTTASPESHSQGMPPFRRSVDELIRAIKKLVGVRPAHRVAHPVVAPSPGERRHAQLSEREFQVLCLIASGLRLNEIAHKLSLSANTVSTYRARTLEKMKMRTNAQLTHYAVRQLLVQ